MQWLNDLLAHGKPAEKPLMVVLTGAGISAESGVPTFRDANGLWENHDIMEVASPNGWAKNPELVLRFYNERRRRLAEVEPNAGHKALVALEQKYNVVVITQNVDNLHERAGSAQILHLHGELTKVRSTQHPDLVYDIGTAALNMGDCCERGAQLRPHIVWFGEDVPFYPIAADIAQLADVFLVVGTSLQVYPAAGLIDDAPRAIPRYVIDRTLPPLPRKYPKLEAIEAPASVGVPQLVERLLNGV